MRALLIFLLLTTGALAQSNPNLIAGQVPTATQWNSFFSAKQDVLGFSPVNKAGDTMLGKLSMNPSTLQFAGLNLGGAGSTPTSPVDGDVWVTTGGMFVRVSGGTVGPLAPASTASAGGSSGQVQWNNGGNLAGLTMSGDCGIVASTGVITCTKTGGVAFSALATLGVGTGLVSSAGNLNLGTVSASQGGTGVNNGASTITIGGAFTTANSLTVSGNFPLTVTTTSTTNVTLPAGSHTLAALDLADQSIGGGANVFASANATGNITVDCGVRPIQTIQNGGAFTITAPTLGGSCILYVLNNGSAGAIAFSGFSEGSNTGDALDTVNGHAFSIFIWKVTSLAAGYRVAAHQ